MRATINFEVDVERVQETMGAVVREELQPLHQAMDLLEISKPQDLHDGITQALEILGAVANQLEQYRDMLASFERARFETLLPQTADGQLVESIAAAQNTVEKMQQFDSFLSQITPPEGEADDPEEG